MDYKSVLTEYYNKFNEDKRLLRRHGQVEFITNIKYLEKYLKDGDKIVDIGAGTGRYSLYFKEKGFDVTALELCRPNIGVAKSKDKDLRIIEGDARKLPFEDEFFDVAILFGPMYHLLKEEEKLEALNEAKRVLKNDGLLFISYLMNDYAVVFHGFIEDAYKDLKDYLDDDFKVKIGGNQLYSYVRIEEIKKLSETIDMKRVMMIASDGPSDYIRPVLNKMDDETFNGYLKYHLSTCEKEELIGASSHVLDILRK